MSAMVLGGAAAARADDAADQWDISFTPYVWAPTINANFKYNVSDITNGPILDAADEARNFSTQIGPNKYLANLNFALMGTVVVHKGDFGVLADFINVNVAGQRSSFTSLSGPNGGLSFPVTAHAQSQIVASVGTIAPTFTAYERGATRVDVLVGGQFLWLSTNANWQLSGPYGVIQPNGGLMKKANYGDVIFGTTGQFGLAKHLSVPFYFDVGTVPGWGQPPFTWEGLVGVKYGGLLLAYRHLDFENGSALLTNLTLSGPELGYTFRF